MFKSVFAKYTIIFALIIIICFAMMIAIITSMVNNYAADEQRHSVAETAESLRDYYTYSISAEQRSSLESYITSSRTQISLVCKHMESVASSSDGLAIILLNEKGEILAFYDSTHTQLSADIYDEIREEECVRINDEVYIESSAFEEIRGKEEPSLTANTDGQMIKAPYFSGRMDLPDGIVLPEGVSGEGVLTYGVRINDYSGKLIGAVVVCSLSDTIGVLLDDMTNTVIMAILWVMFAALIAVYIVSERITGPIKEMSRAVKNFAAGKFDVRVPVRGNDEVAELAVAFNNMAQSLDNLENMRNSFMANVSHDLRTPMTTIAGFIDNILVGAIPPDKHSYYLGIIKDEVKRLSRLVSTLLDLSRMQAGDRKFTMKSFDICEKARQILISFEQKIDTKKLDVEFECDSDRMNVIADKDAIHQVLYNLCDNAVKFSVEGGKFKISITKHPDDDKKVLVTVFNEGQGLTEEDTQMVFERFYKSDKSRGLDKTGVGLGLFISKTIMKAHGEEIYAESEYGKNCLFGFTLKSDDK